jgi:carboxyl-terminal processing protease
MMGLLKVNNSLWCIACISCGLFSSCKKNPAIPSANNTSGTFSGIFEDFWNKMNVNYVYWDIDTTNWDSTYYIYKPLFEKLDINNNNDINTSVGYFRQMTSGIKDAHYTINFIPASISNTFLYPALERKLMSNDFHSPYPYQVIDTNYLDKGFISTGYATSDSERLSVLCGTIHKTILYFSCNRFSLQEAFQSPTNNGVKTALQYFFDEIQNQISNLKGIIIDVRNNAGGNINDLNFFAGHLIGSPLEFGYTRYKRGNGRLAYTPWISANILPQPGGKAIHIPVVALADNYTISLAEAVTMIIHALPTGIVVGETTWGATGPITVNKVYNDGPFSVPGFLSVTTSSAEFKYINGTVYEGKGFPPDINVPFNLPAINFGKDLQLEKAISLIN